MQSRVIEEELLKKGIPYRVYGGVRFFDRAEVKDALAYLRLMSSRNDNVAFERIINVPNRGIGVKTVEIIRAYATDHHLSLWDSTREIVDRNYASKRICKALGNFLHLINQLSISIDTLNLHELVRLVLEKTNLLEFYDKRNVENSQQKLENMKELVNSSIDFCSLNNACPQKNKLLLLEFLSFTVLESGELQNCETDALQMMTLHSSKGLEFPYVFIVGLEDGIFPSLKSMDSFHHLEEERRLCYVGITRAMEKLTLSYSKVRRQYGDIKCQIKSRFLSEISDKYIEFEND